MSLSRALPALAVPAGVLHLEVLRRADWPRLRDMRLAALCESPHFFLSGHENESRYSEGQWRAEFDRGSWYLGILEGTPVSLLGVTREPGAPDSQCYLEYLWVRPGMRGGGVGLVFVSEVLARLRVASVRTVFLWVMDGNAAAWQLYRKAGFVPAGCPQPLAARPGRSEELMKLELSRPSAADPVQPTQCSRPRLAGPAASRAPGYVVRRTSEPAGPVSRPDQ